MEFPILELMDQDGCYHMLLDLLYPGGLVYPVAPPARRRREKGTTLILMPGEDCWPRKTPSISDVPFSALALFCVGGGDLITVREGPGRAPGPELASPIPRFEATSIQCGSDEGPALQREG